MRNAFAFRLIKIAQITGIGSVRCILVRYQHERLPLLVEVTVALVKTRLTLRPHCLEVALAENALPVVAIANGYHGNAPRERNSA